jgi:RNA recognition motif-containing protein
MDVNTGRSRCFAFVRFTSEYWATEAMNDINGSGFQLAGADGAMALSCELAEDKNELKMKKLLRNHALLCSPSECQPIFIDTETGIESTLPTKKNTAWLSVPQIKDTLAM